MLTEDNIFRYMEEMGRFMSGERNRKRIEDLSNYEIISFLREDLPDYEEIWNELEKRLGIEDAEIVIEVEEVEDKKLLE